MTGALVDNDIVIKVAVYGLGEQFVQTTTFLGNAPSILGVGRFVVRDRLSRSGRFNDGQRAFEHFEAMLLILATVEPTAVELEQASAFEAAAVRENLELDTGESQLLAMLLARNARLLVTGDKRATVAIARICGEAAAGRVACFEQVMAEVVEQFGSELVRDAVCREPYADKAATNCCACSSPSAPSAADILDGLRSYIRDLRGGAADVLCADGCLSSLAAEKDGEGIHEASN